MHPFLGNLVAIGRAVVHCGQDAHALSAEIKFRHCSYIINQSIWIVMPGEARLSWESSISIFFLVKCRLDQG